MFFHYIPANENLNQITFWIDHWIGMNVKLIIVQLLSTREKLDSLDKIKRTLELCNNYLEVYDKVSRGYTKWRGHILELQSSAVLKQHEILSEQVSCSINTNYVTEAASFQITFY